MEDTGRPEIRLYFIGGHGLEAQGGIEGGPSGGRVVSRCPGGKTAFYCQRGKLSKESSVAKCGQIFGSQ